MEKPMEEKHQTKPNEMKIKTLKSTSIGEVKVSKFGIFRGLQPIF
jgi:hypothetical protein